MAGLGALFVLAVATSGLAAGAAGADATSLSIRKVDTTKFPKVSISAIAVGGTPDLSKFTLRENGAFVDPKAFNVTPIDKTPTPVGVVLAIDVSDGMKDQNRFALVKAAAKQFVQHKAAADQVAIVAYATTYTQISDFTSDSSALTASLDKLALGGGRREWDAVAFSAGLFDAHPELQHNIVLVTGGRDTLSKQDSNAALQAVLDRHAAVFVLALTGKDFEETAPRGLAEGSGGQFLATADPNAIAGLAARAQQSLADQYLITYTSIAKTPTIDLEVSVGAVSATAKAVSPGTVSEGASLPQVLKPSGLGFLHSDSVKWAVGGLALLAGGLGAFALLSLTVKEESTLSAAIRPYNEAAPIEESDGKRPSFADTGLIKRAVGLTGRLADSQGILERVERQLEEANLPLRAAEAIFFYLAGVVTLSLIALFAKGVVIGAFVLFLTVAGPMGALNYAVKSRRKKFTSQLPDMLQLLSGTLRAGYSMLQGVEAVSTEVQDPMGHELRRVLGEARLGRPLEEALDDCAARMGSDDFSWAVMAISIQREVGGNLAELLATVGETMVSRERLRGEIRALTAEGKISAIVLGLLPLGLGVAMYTINPKYMSVLFHDPIGQAMLAGAIVWAMFGFWWMKKTIAIEV